MTPRRALFVLVASGALAVLAWAMRFDYAPGTPHPWATFFAALFSMAFAYSLLWLVIFTGVREGVRGARPKP